MAGLASRLAQQHQITLLTLDSATHDRYEVTPEVERIGLGLIRTSRNRLLGAAANFQRVAAVRAAISQRTPEAVLCFCDQMNVVTLAATRPLRIPTVVTEFTDPRHQRLPLVWQVMRRMLYPTAAFGVALNRSTLSTVQRWVRGPVAIISAAVDAPPPGFKRQLNNTRQRIVGLGRLSREKGFDRLVAAFAAVAAKHPSWDLHLAGDGPERTTIESQVHEANLDNRVYFHGWIKDVWAFLEHADVFALTSHYDGFPVAILEAMAGGIPVISVDCDSGPREIIRHEENGLLVANDHDSLCAGLDRIMSDGNLREQLSANGPEVMQRLSWDQFVADYELVLRRAIAGDRDPPQLH